MTPQRMMERMFPAGHTYKVALYPGVVDLTSYTPDGEWSGAGYAPGGATLSGFRIETDGEEAVLRFNNVDWWNADIQMRTAVIYDADTLDVINTTQLERTAGVFGGFFEYKMPDEGVFRLG